MGNKGSGFRPGEVVDGAGLSRRSFLQITATSGAAASLPGWQALAEATSAVDDERFAVFELSIADMAAAMESGAVTSERLVRRYLRRIGFLDRTTDESPGVNAIAEINRDAIGIARALDEERATSGPRGPLHGIPILLKDTIDTADRMQTTAGSLALRGDPATQDATVAARLRAAGAVILGKANLSEWANFRGFNSSSGWGARGGQVSNPYVLDRNPCGSSSGSAAAVSANFCAAAIGTETDGSIVCPSSACGVVGIKPTVGLTSRAGVVPIALTQDTVGVHGRTVADAAAVLGVLTGQDPRDPATAPSAEHGFADYTQFVDAAGLDGARIGVERGLAGFSAVADEVFEAALAAMRDVGATVEEVSIPTLSDHFNDISELVILLYEFKRDLNAYLASRTGVPVGSLADVIAFNLEHADEELRFFGQEWMELAQAELFSEADYQVALATGPRLAGAEGLDAVLDQHGLDALVAPTGSPAWTTDLVNGDHFLGASSSLSAVAGYPIVTIPAGTPFGLPVGISFLGRAWSEPTLIRLGSGFEAATKARRPPRYQRTVSTTTEKAGRARQRDLEQLAGRLRSGGQGLRRRLGVL